MENLLQCSKVSGSRSGTDSRIHTTMYPGLLLRKSGVLVRELLSGYESWTVVQKSEVIVRELLPGYVIILNLGLLL